MGASQHELQFEMKCSMDCSLIVFDCWVLTLLHLQKNKMCLILCAY